MMRDRYLHTATLLQDGAVLLAGGLHQATAEIYRLDRNGSPCAGPEGCESGFCVDGLCCDTACTDACSRCDVPGAEGTCASPCLDATHAQLCPDAAGGACSDTAACASVSCAPFLCTVAARGCATTCATVRDCAPGFACDGDGRCVAPPDAVDGDAGACSLEGAPSRAPAAALALGALVAAIGLRRRR
jgi:MYXO-CTERM domain-containing protein